MNPSKTSRLPAPDADELAHSERLLQHLRETIAARGPIPFSQYSYSLLKFSRENNFTYPYRPWPAAAGGSAAGGSAA